VDKLATTLETTQDAEELVAAAEWVSDALESYNRGAQRVHAAQTVELRCMIEMLSQTLVALAQAGGQSIETLQAIRNQVENARQLDDIRLLRARLGDTLKSISDEAKRQRDRNVEILLQAEDAAEVAAGHRKSQISDRVSQLPSSAKAERAITDRAGPGSKYYAAAFVVERVDSLNLRYGYSAGDQLLREYHKYLESKLALTDELYRWRGPTFLVLMERPYAIDVVRAEVARFASNRQEHVMDVGGGTIKLPLSSAWTVVELAKCEVAGQASQQIDRFVAEHWEKRS
jgi:GGDEF domain-containing protein